MHRFGKFLGFGLVLVLWVSNVSRIGSPWRRSAPTPGEFESTLGESRRPTGSELRVLTLNTLHGFPRFENQQERLDLIVGTLALEQPDIVCLQEASWALPLGYSAAYIADQSGYHTVYARANGNRWAILFEEGEAILSRYPLRSASVVELLPRAGPFQQRIALQAIAATPEGEVRIVAAHLTHSNANANEGQAASLGALAESSDYPTVVCGDLNAPETAPQIQRLAETMMDAYRTVNPERNGWTCCVDDLTSSQELLSQRIDYIFVTPGPWGQVRIDGAQTVLDRPVPTANGALWASDHAGVIVDLAWRD